MIAQNHAWDINEHYSFFNLYIENFNELKVNKN
jgi:hypothetical protein